MKKIILLTMFFILIPIAWALPMCEDKLEINTNCTMVTPTISCGTYNYSIINTSSGSSVTDGDLTLLNGNIYYFNFTEGEGDYLVILCDDTTREVRVTQEDENKMILGVLILAPLILGAFLLIGAATLGEEHNVLRIFLFLLSPITFFVSLHFAAVGLAQFYNVPELLELIGSTTYWAGMVFFAIVTYFIIYWFYKITHMMAEKKEERLNY